MRWLFAAAFFACSLELAAAQAKACRRRRQCAADGGQPTEPPPPSTTPPMIYQKPSDALVFLTVGDWGGNSDSSPCSFGQEHTARGMGTAAQIMGADFILGVGDNFYPNGLHEGNQWRMQKTFEEVYTHQSLMVPWYQQVGNHDWGHDTVQLQIEHTRHSDRWVMPAPLYSFRKTLPSGKTAKFVRFDIEMIDDEHRYKPLSSHDSKGKMKGVEWSKTEIVGPSAAWEWLERELDSPQDDYLFLVDHKPVYTACSHGNTEELERVPELMHKYKVTAFISGHDHCLIHMEKDGNTFILSGAGSQAWNHNEDEAPFRAIGGKVRYSLHRHNKPDDIHGGFATMELTDSEMKVRYHDDAGRVLEEIGGLRPRMRTRAGLLV